MIQPLRYRRPEPLGTGNAQYPLSRSASAAKLGFRRRSTCWKAASADSPQAVWRRSVASCEYLWPAIRGITFAQFNAGASPGQGRACRSDRHAGFEKEGDASLGGTHGRSCLLLSPVVRGARAVGAGAGGVSQGIEGHKTSRGMGRSAISQRRTRFLLH